jgi:hypothetical protein
MNSWKRAGSEHRAIEQMRVFLSHGVPGSRAERRILLTAGIILASAIWSRFGVGVRKFQLKHLKWYMATRMPKVPAERLKAAWECICLVSMKLGRFDNWWPGLQGEMQRACVIRNLEPFAKPSLTRTRPTKPVPTPQSRGFVFDGHSLPAHQLRALAKLTTAEKAD